MSNNLILTGDAMREADRQRNAGLTRQQRRALERKAESQRTADRVVNRALNGQDSARPGEAKILVGEDKRPANIGDVLKLLEIALIEYDQRQQSDVVEFIEFRLSLRGRFVAARARWRRRFAVLEGLVRELADHLDPAPGETMDDAEANAAPFQGCLVAGEQTDGHYYCTRAPGHTGPCAAVPVSEAHRP